MACPYEKAKNNNRPRCPHYISTSCSSVEKESLTSSRIRRREQSRIAQRLFRQRRVKDPEAQLDTFEHQSTVLKSETERHESELPKTMKESLARTQPVARTSAPLEKPYHARKSSETAWDALRRILRQQRLDNITLILQTIQILAAARRSMTVSELNFAGGTLFRVLRDHREGAKLPMETLKRIIRSEINYVELCGELLYVDSSGNVDFCHEDMRSMVSSVEFRQAFGLRNASEVLTAICIQHLGCGEQTLGMGSTRQGKCTVIGQATCTFQAYAALFWKKHYLETNGGSQWIHSLLHEAIASSATKAGSPDMQCQRRCNRVLATGLEMAATHDLHVIGRTYVEMGAEVGLCTHSCHTPLHTAVANSSVNMVKLLLECGANPNTFANDIADSPTPLCGPSEHAIPSSLINCGPNHEGKCHCWRCCGCASGRTPLHMAAATGDEASIRLLLAAGASIDVPTMRQGDTALHLAAKSGNVEAVRCLIDSGANVWSRNSVEETALGAAVREQRRSTAEFLHSLVYPHVTPGEPCFNGGTSAYAKVAGVGDNEHTTPDSPILNMQHLSLQDKLCESSSPTPEDLEEEVEGATNSTSTCTGDGPWVLV